MRFRSNKFVYRSYNTVDDFSYSFDINVDTLSDSTRTIRGSFLTLTNTTEDIIYHRDNNYECITIVLQSYDNANKFYLGLYQWENGGRTFNSTAGIQLYDVDTWYYLTIERVGNHYTLYVYSDSDRNTLINDLRLSPTNVYNYNKVMAVCNYGYGTTENSEGWVKDLYLDVFDHVEEGFLFFDNLLSESNNRPAIWFLSNQTLNDHSLAVGFSSDNNSWVYYSLNECFESIFLEPYNYTDLYVRYNFTNGISTPVLYNASLFYESDTTISDSQPNYWWIVLFFIFIPSLIVLGVAKIR
jgi:hypothetical protein